MKGLLVTIVSLLSLVNVLSVTAVADDSIYEGVWHTTNRKLDGTMTCVVTDLGLEKWRGRFSFTGNFGGSRYEGYFDLKTSAGRKPKQ